MANKNKTSKKAEKSKRPIEIIHIMKDGTVRDSIEGYEIPVNEDTKVIYAMLAGVKMDSISLKEDGSECKNDK